MPTFASKFRGQKTISTSYRSRKMGTIRYAKKNRKPKNKSMVRFGLGLPKKCLVTHKYNEFVLLTSTAGIKQNYLYSCNGMFDPNITGTGHQPMYFDQFSALYDHYTVIGSRITVRLTPTAAGEDGFRVALFLNDDTTVTPDISGIIEQSSGSHKLIPPGSNNTYVLTKNWSAKKTFGGSILGNDDLQGNATSNPVEQTYFSISLGGTSAVDVVCTVDVTIEYTVIWDELKDLASS